MISFLKKLSTYFKVFIFKPFKLNRVLSSINKHYQSIPSYSLSKQYREKTAPQNPDFIYGELSIKSFIYLLGLLPLDRGGKLYDLGCGDAKLIVAAGLYYQHIQVSGLEIVPDLAQAAQKAIEVLKKKIVKNHSSVNVLAQSFLSFDFSDANIVYISGSALSLETWDNVISRLSKLSKGTYVISVGRIMEAPLKLIYTGIHATSWGQALVYIYQK